jgi:hypothetical protein
MSGITYNKNKSILIRNYLEELNMPRGDGTGPAGPGSGQGRRSKRGFGGGRMDGPLRAGPGGFCECPKCKAKVPHQLAVPCNDMKCPQCGSTMVRV